MIGIYIPFPLLLLLIKYGTFVLCNILDWTFYGLFIFLCYVI